MHTYFGNFDRTEYEIQNWIDDNTWRLKNHANVNYNNQKSIIEALRFHYKNRRYDIIARMMLGLNFKECSKDITSNSFPIMTSWSYESTYIEYLVLHTILSDEKVVKEMKRMKELADK